MEKSYKYGLRDGAATAGILGCMGAIVVGGVTALFAGPVALAAAIGAVAFGLFGAAGSAVGASTSGTGDWKGSWHGGLPATALLAIATYAALNYIAPQTTPSTTQTTVSTAFNAESAVKKISPNTANDLMATKRNESPHTQKKRL